MDRWETMDIIIQYRQVWIVQITTTVTGTLYSITSNISLLNASNVSCVNLSSTNIVGRNLSTLNANISFLNVSNISCTNMSVLNLSCQMLV